MKPTSVNVQVMKSSLASVSAIQPKSDGAKGTMSVAAQAAKLFREKGKAAISEIQKLKKQHPGVDLDGILHKAKQEKIVTAGKKMKEKSIIPQENTGPTPLISAIEKDALVLLMKSEREKTNISPESLSILSAAMSNKTKFVKAHFAILEDSSAASYKQRANVVDKLGRIPLFYAVFHGIFHFVK